MDPHPRMDPHSRMDTRMDSNQSLKAEPSEMEPPEIFAYSLPQPEESLDSQPRFLNPKQYYRIMKRRYQKAKYFQTHVLIKQLTAYKHLSRHQHARRRQRGVGGRFLKREETQKKTSPKVEENSDWMDGGDEAPNVTLSSEWMGRPQQQLLQH